jgi:hypothetical protein
MNGFLEAAVLKTDLVFDQGSTMHDPDREAPMYTAIHRAQREEAAALYVSHTPFTHLTLLSCESQRFGYFECTYTLTYTLCDCARLDVHAEPVNNIELSNTCKKSTRKHFLLRLYSHKWLLALTCFGLFSGVYSSCSEDELCEGSSLRASKLSFVELPAVLHKPV